MKKGFTLTEVIVVIVILSVIILLAIPAYLGVTETLKKQDYDNKVKQIEIKATEWAEDNNLTENTTISLARLIDEGYIQMDDEASTDKRVINPLNNESMECYHIIITIENGNYKTKLEESKDCELKFQEEQDNNIKVVGYEIDASTHKIISNKELKVNGGELEWSGKDILLVTTSEVYQNPRSITFSTGSTNDKKSGNMYLGTPTENEVINPDNYQNTYIVSASLILRSKYSITYEMENENPRKTVLVKIDKESPNGEASMLEKWGTKESKKVKLSGSDGVGSGIKGYYTNTSNNINTAEYHEGIEVEVSLALGIHYFWVEDNVGNRSKEGGKIEVTNIDSVAPTCSYPEGNTNWTKDPVTIEWGCEDYESGCVKKKEKVEYKDQNQNVATLTVYNGNDYENGVRGEYIYDVAGNRTFCAARDISVLYDTKAPSCNITTPAKIGKNSWYVENAVLTLETEDDGSGIKSKGLSTRNTTDYNNKTQVTQTSTTGITYYGYVEDKLGNKANCSKGLKVDSVAPTCIVPSGNGTWTKNAVSIEWGCQDGTSGCTTSTQKYTFNQANTEVDKYRIYSGNPVIEDQAGNKTTCTQRDISIKYDSKAPSCTITTPAKIGKNSWYVENAVLTLNTDDKGSGIKSKGLSTKNTIDYNNKTQVTQTTTKGITYYGYAEDQAGNKANCSKGLKVDTSAPSLSFGISGLNSATVSCTDGESGVVGSTNYTVNLANGANRNVEITCTNQAGLSTKSSHNYTYSSCQVGDPNACIADYVSESCWNSGLNCYDHPYSCTKYRTSTCYRTEDACVSWSSSEYDDANWDCNIPGCTWCLYDVQTPYSCQKPYTGTCYKYSCDGDWDTCTTWSNCAYRRNTCQAGFRY